MPSPLLHSAVALASARGCRRSPSLRLYLLSLIASTFPDIDLLPGVLLGDLHRFHHLYTHSLIVAPLMGLLLAGFRWVRPSEDGQASYSARLKYLLPLSLSHPLLDLLNNDGLPGDGSMHSGIALWWPLDAGLTRPLVRLFPTVVLDADWRSILTHRNLKICLLDILVAALIVHAASFCRRRVRGPA